MNAYDWTSADWLAVEAVLVLGLLGFCTALPDWSGYVLPAHMHTPTSDCAISGKLQMAGSRPMLLT